MTELEILAFEPAELRARGVGPFQNAFERVELTTREGQPSNLFLLCSANGRGKTTLLEVFVYLCSFLDDAPARPAWLEDAPLRDLQLDIWLSLRRDGIEERLLLTLFDLHRDLTELRLWDEAQLARLPASRQLTWGQVRSGFNGTFGGTAEELVTLLRRQVRIAGADDPHPEAAPLAPVETAPTILYFSFDRDIPAPARAPHEGIQMPDHWRYQLVHRFGHDLSWGSSLDLLLVWLHWLDQDGGRYKRAVDIVNHVVFRGGPKFLERVDRPKLRAIIQAGIGEHRLDQLSSGERNELLLFLRVAVHMTRNTIVVIDELDLHLHPRIERALVRKLELLVQGRLEDPSEWGPFEEDTEQGARPARPLVSVLFTTHSTSCMDEFDHLEGAPRLRTGAHVIEEDFK